MCQVCRPSCHVAPHSHCLGKQLLTVHRMTLPLMQLAPQAILPSEYTFNPFPVTYAIFRAERILEESGVSIAPPMCTRPSTSTQLPPPPDPIAGHQCHSDAARAQSSKKPSHDGSHSDSSHNNNNGEDNEDNASNVSDSSNSDNMNEDGEDNEDSDNGNDSENSDNNNNNNNNIKDNKDNSNGSKGKDNSNEEEGTKPIDEPRHIDTLTPSTLSPNTLTPDIIVTDMPMTNVAHKAHNPTNDIVSNTLTTTTPVTDTPTMETPPRMPLAQLLSERTMSPLQTLSPLTPL